jgi:hypothetical protein
MKLFYLPLTILQVIVPVFIFCYKQIHPKGAPMDIQGSSGVAHALMVKSAQMANDQQKQEGQAVLQLLQSAQAMPMPSTSSVGGTINTQA